MNRSTHTYAVLNVSQSTYNEIREKLKTAAYDHAFHENGIIDMHGIGIQADEVSIGKVSIETTINSPSWRSHETPSISR